MIRNDIQKEEIPEGDEEHFSDKPISFLTFTTRTKEEVDAYHRKLRSKPPKLTK